MRVIKDAEISQSRARYITNSLNDLITQPGWNIEALLVSYDDLNFMAYYAAMFSFQVEAPTDIGEKFKYRGFPLWVTRDLKEGDFRAVRK